MGCNNCSSKHNGNSGIPRGCGNKGNCGTDSCNKLPVFDWLANMEFPTGHIPFDIVEVRFKNGRKEFFKNTDKLPLHIGDVIATEANPGHDIGTITLTGELVKVQMNKKKISTQGNFPKVYRKATQRDIDVWGEAQQKEEPTRERARELAIHHQLEMKISDVEFQGDGSKAIFYYTAEGRVDFRQLIKDFAREFNIRVEMKQIGFRQEAARLGGIGSCGRELCCSTWLTDFRSVNTTSARYQQLALNPQKLAGQCGKLKCCLNFELDAYMDALKDMPDADTKIPTEKGIAICQKMDIFRGVMWFAYPDNMVNWYMLNADDVKDLIAMVKNGETISSIEDYVFEEEGKNEEKGKVFQTALSEDSINRFDKPTRKKRPSNKKKNTSKTAEEKNNNLANSNNKNKAQANSSKNSGKNRNNKPKFTKTNHNADSKKS